MAEYIEREETKKAINTWDKFRYDITTRQMLRGEDNDHITLVRLSDVINCVNNMPSADVQPVKRGRWTWDSNAPHREHGAYKCSNCGCHSDFEENYCYNCGARMGQEG